jgi:putative DNA primase/helicase
MSASMHEPSVIACAIGPVARELLGDPTEESPDELRFGTRGSMCIDLKKGTFFDHEADEGGGVIDLVMTRRNIDKDDAIQWLRDRGHVSKPNKRVKRERPKREERPPSGLPVIRVTAGELHTITTAAEHALIASGLPVYQRGNTLVQPVTREVPASRGRMTLAAGLGDLTVPAMIDAFCQVAEWERYDARAEDWVRINPPTKVAQILLTREGKWRVAVIAGVITTPTLRPDGSLLTAPGYDKVTRLYHAADPTLTLHPAVHAPTRAHAEAALKLLEGLLVDFPFVKEERPGQPDLEISKAVALSGMLTAVVRGAMPVAPLHAINAHAPSSGKSYLVDVISAIGSGRPCPVIAAAPEEAETEKRIAGLLLSGSPIVSIDNCNGELGGDLLCQAVERPLVRIRRLGASDIIEVESVVTLFATGNNLRVRGDMVRRSLVAELDPQVERPELRQFDANPVAMVEADRGRYVSACLIIVRAYIVAGRPKLLQPLASFNQWSDLVRSALAWLGCADPVLSMEAARDNDPELSELREVMAAWKQAFGAVPTTCRQAIDAALERAVPPDEDGDVPQYGQIKPRHPELHDALARIAPGRTGIDPIRLGRWLLKHDGRMIGTDRFKKDGTTDGAARWKLEATRSAKKGG